MKTIPSDVSLKGIQAATLHALWEPRTIGEIRDFVYPDELDRGDGHVRSQLSILKGKGFSIRKRGRVRTGASRRFCWRYEVVA